MRRTRNPILPLLAVLCGLASVGFIIWALQREMPTHSDFTSIDMAAETPAEEAESAQPGPPEPSPEGPVESTAMTEPVPDSAPADEAPPTKPEPIPEEELTGPLPSRSQEGDSAATHAEAAILPAPGAITITPPPGPPSSPAALAETPHLWPGRVVLGTPVSFPIILNGVQAGNVVAAKGSAVVLKKVLPEGRLIIEWNGASATVAAASTDLMARVAAAAATRSQESAAPASTPATAKASPSAASPTPQVEAAKPKLNITVTRNRRSEGAIGGPTRQSWVFKVRVQNPTADPMPNVSGRLFVFTNGKGDELIVAANEELATDVKANSEVTLEPPPLPLGPDSAYDSYAVVLRDGTGTIVGSVSFREAATKDWKALEETKVGSAAPRQR